MTLTEFLLARFAEDEAWARSWNGFGAGDVHWVADYPDGGSVSLIANFDPARVLTECEAKRRIIALHQPHDPLADIFDGCQTCLTDRERYKDDWWPDSWPCPTLLALALPYADHPDYRPEWRP